MSSVRKRHVPSLLKSSNTYSKTEVNEEKCCQTTSSRFLITIFIGLSIGLGLVTLIKFIYGQHEYKAENLLDYSPDPRTLDADRLRQWGSLKSGHYFGLKTHHPDSLSFGLMWFPNRVIDNNLQLRHLANQHDRLHKYGWTRHNFHDFGIQEIVDEDFNITTSFLIQNKTSWTARIRVDMDQSRTAKLNRHINDDISFIAYTSFDSLVEDEKQIQNFQKVFVDGDAFNYGLPLNIYGVGGGFTEGFSMKIKPIKNAENILYKSHILARSSKPLVSVEKQVMENIFFSRYPGQESNPNRYLLVMKDRNDVERKEKLPINKANMVLHQIIVKAPFEFEVQFSDNEKQQEKLSDYETELKQQINKFDQRFESLFKLKEKGYSVDVIEFAKSALSNLLGSIGKFHGYSLVRFFQNEHQRSENLDSIPVKAYGPLNLLTAVPSRSFFPRGFLWDEGFHQLLVAKFDLALSQEIISSWFRLINADGWIPREVILGLEAIERVPKEFIVQSNLNANPPTFFIAIEELLIQMDNLNESPDTNDFVIESQKKETLTKNLEFLKEIFPKLQVWYAWFNNTQTGPSLGSYRWRGRDANSKNELNVKTLTSGLDDYPRASSPNDKEMHVDLFCWMDLATRSMAKIAKHIGDSSQEKYESYRKYLIDNDLLDKFHWSEEHKMYCDFGLHSNNVKLLRKPGNLQKVRVELEPSKYQCVPEIGYVNLFPFLLRLVDASSEKVLNLVQMMRNNDLLWTSYGLRSIAKNSSYYGARNTETDPPYWRGPIWININYLALKALKHYANEPGPAQELSKKVYFELRENVIANMFKQYKRTGYIWEQYDDITGQGKGSHPFTGWSALVLLIMADSY